MNCFLFFLITCTVNRVVAYIKHGHFFSPNPEVSIRASNFCELKHFLNALFETPGSDSGEELNVFVLE